MNVRFMRISNAQDIPKPAFHVNYMGAPWMDWKRILK
jgi:hypothetical protein